MGKTIHLAHVTVKTKSGIVTYNNRSYVDGETHIKGMRILKVEIIGELGKTVNK